MPSWLADIIYPIINFGWPVLTLPLLAIGIWIIYEALNHRSFHKFMSTNGYPVTRSRRLRSIRATAAGIRDSRIIGGAWFIRRTHGCILFVSSTIFAVSLLRAGVTGHSLEFSRSGSLVVIAGLASILIGFMDSRKTRQSWERIATVVEDDARKKMFEKAMVSPIENAHFVAAKKSVFISVAGTVIWAYGDQILACGLFPLVNIIDKSGVACM